jgi:hypothetical protein
MSGKKHKPRWQEYKISIIDTPKIKIKCCLEKKYLRQNHMEKMKIKIWQKDITSKY